MGRAETESVNGFLESRLATELDDEGREALLDALEERREAAGAVLLAQGEVNDHLSFLVKGTAVVIRNQPGGRIEALTTLTAPSVFGTTSFFGPRAPSYAVKAATDVHLLTLTHPAHDRLRERNPKVAGALVLASLRVLSERFDDLDRMFTRYIAEHPDDTRKVTEWAGFRARLFGEPGL